MRPDHEIPHLAPARRRWLAVAVISAIALGAIGLGAGAGGADGRKAQMLGKTDRTPRPSCPAPRNPSPAEECQAVGEVTAIQMRAAGKRNVMKLPVDARIVAWSVRLRRPDSASRQFFEERLSSERYGDGPVARIGVLRRTSKREFELSKQSDPVKLDAYFGETPIFTLDRPLGAKAGRYVGLTVPTWLTNFAHSIGGRNNIWKASRVSNRCGGDTRAEALENLTERSRPHQVVGSERVYGCNYRGARVIYWVYYVPVNSGS